MEDVTKLVGAVSREVRSGTRDGQPVRSVVASRVYKTDIADAWDALTSPERIARWFGKVDGELRLGGRYQIQGNASGTITRCEPPRELHVTWEFGGGISWVEATLEAAEAGSTRLTLMHICPVDEHMNTYGPGAVGVGWELGLVGLQLHLEDRANSTPGQGDVWAASDEGKRFQSLASDDWARAAIAAGDDPAHAREAAARVTAFYTGAGAP